jgi:hypothetical protein
MWKDTDLSLAFETQNTINLESLIISEFNLNNTENISKIGNYRYRPESEEGQFLEPISSYDIYDRGDYYSDAEISYIEYTGTDEGKIFKIENTKDRAYYSLGDCFLPFRPRSGINKVRFFDRKFIDNIRSSERPRYYMPSKTDYFKYWSSYRKENNIERGISKPFNFLSEEYLISDACPFIVYKNPIYFNRFVVKVQTNVGTLNLGTIRTTDDKVITDPLYDYKNATVPITFKIQKLNSDNSWEDIIEFDRNSTRNDGSPIFPKDGHLEIFYGVKIPSEYLSTFNLIDYIDESLLPNKFLVYGNAYIVNHSLTSPGDLKIWNGEEWQTYTVEYEWSLYENDMPKSVGTVKKPVDPEYFNNTFREFDQAYGIRIVVKTMNAPDSTLDIIELSPRLTVDISKYVESFSISKSIVNDDLGIPVGNLSVSTGDVSIVNFDNILSEENVFNGESGSLISQHANQNSKFIFYEKILNINGSDKYIPIKTFYAEEFPRPSGGDSSVSVTLRDLFFRLETTNSPSIFSSETTLTFAVSQILDYIGFSNYVFKNIDSGNDPIIPYLFVEPNISVAEILTRIAVATQTAMFFDEYNNFVVMSKEYLLPSEGNRIVDFKLYGNNFPLANIEAIEDNETKVLNDGQITYTTRYVQRDVDNLQSALLLDEEKIYKNKAVLLWEVSGTEETKTTNSNSKESSSFALTAMALNSDINNQNPVVVNRKITNNIIDVGENIYFVARFQGYFYSNGEIIRYDAVEFAIPGRSNEPLVWISSNQEYQKYFGELAFGGKIYPTGRIRIYCEPFYEDISGRTFLQNGEVRSSGRAQFDTEISDHSAGLPEYWSNENNTYGVQVDSSMIFTTKELDKIQDIPDSVTRIESNTILNVAKKSTRNGIIKNFMSSKTYEDGFINKLKTTSSGTIQASALVFKGPAEDQIISNHRDLMSYVYKDLSENFSYRHFGTRMRIIGKQDQNSGQIASGSMSLYSIKSENTSEPNTIDGGSGGLGIMVNTENGSGYYFEIIALDIKDIESVSSKNSSGDSLSDDNSAIHNIIFYKIKNGINSQDTSSTKAIAKKLWGGLASIITDSGVFAGQTRIANEGNISVYDLAIEYQDLSNGSRRFYLYVNNNLVKVVDDNDPLENRTNVSLFVRGSSQCMFENVYAMDNLLAKDSGNKIIDYSEQFAQDGITVNEYLRKYALSGIIQATYLSGISSESQNTYKIYFEEFGSILRECYYFNVQYDQAYPSFYSQIAESFSNDKGYTVSGFYGGPYEAEFLVFNASDKAIVLDESTGNYLRIFGTTFTQQTTQTLTVDEYFKKISSFSEPVYDNFGIISPQVQISRYNEVKSSRAKYGQRQFSMDSIYIQSQDQAEDLMGWIIEKTMRPRKQISMTVFPMPQAQLGDLVTIEYTMPGGVDYVNPELKFIIKEINYSRSPEGPSQSIRLVEV